MRLLVDAKNLDYRELNSKVRKFLSSNGANAVITIKNVLGQRYIGDGAMVLKALLISISMVRPGMTLVPLWTEPQLKY